MDVAGVEPGDLIVLVAGLPIGISGGTNLLRVLALPKTKAPKQTGETSW